MKIKPSRTTHTLYRYNGVVDGKGSEYRIGSVPVGTKPDSIPKELAYELSGRENEELVEFLEAEQRSLKAALMAEVTTDLAAVAEMLATSVMDDDAVSKLIEAMSRTSTVARRLQARSKRRASPVVKVPQGAL